jgi:nucleoside-diphosphate-sugar epimerase
VYANDPNARPVTEESALEPHSLYSETKIAAENWLRQQAAGAASALVTLRQATAYGLSPRIRFDLLVNQFVLEAYLRRELTIFQQSFARCFVHIHDAVRGYMAVLDAPAGKVREQIYNLGSERGNYTKDEVVSLVLSQFPDVMVRYKDVSFGGDQRDLTVSFQKIQRELGFSAHLSVDEGIDEVAAALRGGLIRNPYDRRYRNAEILAY